MPRWQEILRTNAKLLWLGAAGALALICLALLVSIWLSGRNETADADAAGRRLLIAMDTGEVTGKIITLDAPVAAPAPEPKPPAESEAAPTETPSSPAEVPPSEASPLPPADATAPSESAPAAPMPEANQSLQEKTEEGLLPVIGSDGAKPWRYYSKPFERKRNQPMVAIVVTGLGVNRAVTQDALHLHEYVTLSFSPYARDLASWLAAARATGHEMLVDLPLEPADYPLTDPGPNGLILERGDMEAEKNLKTLMARFPTSMGFLTPQNESFTANDEAIKLLLQSLANRGLMLIVGREPHKKETRDVIYAGNTASAVADVLLDEELTPTVIQERLNRLEEQAKKHGYAIGVAQPYPITIEQLQPWMKSLAEKGIVLVPVSAIVKLRFS